AAGSRGPGAGPNGGPVAGNVTATTDEDTAVDIDALAYASDPKEEPLTLSISNAPVYGTAVVNDHGTPGDPVDDYITYTPDPYYTGPDQLTYRVEDDKGGSASASVTITVNPKNHARLVPPPDRADVEGATISLPLVTPDNNGRPVTYAASGLPAGLSVNSSTGVLSG